MNDTLRKYELMKELGIESDITRERITSPTKYWWHKKITHTIEEEIVAAILERACRKWLEKKQSIYINTDDQGFYYAFYMQRSTDPITGIECEYDAAQIAALEYCLKERTTQCTDN